MRATVQRSNRTLWSALLLAGLPFCLSVDPAQAQTAGADRPKFEGPLSVEQAVRTGLRENLMLRAARADVSAAAAETRIARSQTRPQISANTYVAYGDFSNILSSAPGVAPTNYLSVPSQGFADQNLTLMAPLYTSGRLGHMVQAAALRERAVSQELGGVQAETTLRIKEAYYRALLAGDVIRVAQSRVEADIELVRNAQALFTAGKGLEASVRRVEAERAEADRALTTARNNQAKALLDLKAAMGVPLDSAITLSDALTFVSPSGNLTIQLSDATRLRPELAASRSRQQAAEAQTRSVRGSQGPQVAGMAMADGWFTSHASGTREGYTVGVVISLPILDGGQRRAETDRARAQAERADAERRDLELRIANEVSQAWLDVGSAAENYRSAQTGLTAAQAAYDVTALRVQNQKGLLVEQLDALASVVQARGNVAQALYDHALAVARLQRAVGKP